MHYTSDISKEVYPVLSILSAVRMHYAAGFAVLCALFKCVGNVFGENRKIFIFGPGRETRKKGGDYGRRQRRQIISNHFKTRKNAFPFRQSGFLPVGCGVFYGKTALGQIGLLAGRFKKMPQKSIPV